MTPETFLDGKVTLFAGDMLTVLPTLEKESVDSCVCDPPYHLTSIVKRFANAKPENEVFSVDNPSRQFGVLSRGFMGEQWDGGGVAFDPATWRAVWRVLKPGAHLVAFGGTRTYHRLACAIEDAGFEIRDTIMWLYGSGFPKSHDVSKGIDRAAGAEREIVAQRNGVTKTFNVGATETLKARDPITAPATDAAREWSGWGTALKPAVEPIVLARKPLSEPTVAANVLRWRTGALNINGCRVAGTFESGWSKSGSKASENICMSGPNYGRDPKPDNLKGRWPANVAHDGSDEVVAAFPETGAANASAGRNGNDVGDVFSLKRSRDDVRGHDDNGGSAARFFYTAKADSDDRLGSKHPTVKPLDLMQWLVRLVTPKGGLVLDPFAGTGSTAEAAWREGFSATLIEREAEYVADIRRRMALALAGPDERVRESVKARGNVADPGPLFAPRPKPEWHEPEPANLVWNENRMLE